MIFAAGPEEVAPRTLYRILRLRNEVFVVEQGCAFLDLDGRDLEPSTLHVWADPEPGEPTVAACLRVLRPTVDGAAATPGAVRIGRVATAVGWRRRGLASALVDHALSLAGEAPVVLDAQAHLVEWYHRWGFERAGADFVEDGIVHVPLRRAPARLPRGPGYAPTT
jgi:ElaA protein